MLLLSLPPLSPSPFTPHGPAPAIDDLRLTAMELLLSSVKLTPYNWSAWLKLASCLDGTEEVRPSFPSLPRPMLQNADRPPATRFPARGPGQVPPPCFCLPLLLRPRYPRDPRRRQRPPIDARPPLRHLWRVRDDQGHARAHSLPHPRSVPFPPLPPPPFPLLSHLPSSFLPQLTRR